VVRVVITGATGNVGTSLLAALGGDPSVESVLGLARRRPALQLPKTSWAEADVSSTDLVPLFRGADAVVHLAWLIQPSHDLETLRKTNVDGSERVFRAVADAGVPSLVHASSVGTYSPGPKDRPVDESWPTEGVRSSFYARHKAAVERLLDRFEAEVPQVRVVRLRPALIFKREAASGVRRLFFGPFLPTALVRPDRIPVVPAVKNLRFQCVHSLDVGEAYRLAVTRDVRGPFNVAADPILDPERLAELLDARRVPIAPAVLRAGAAATWRLRLQPTPPGWVDQALGVPVLDSTRAREELGWTPRFDAGAALVELLEGLHDRAGLDTPPLSPDTGGPFRLRELRTRIGGRST
jgi:UDP-glucose 4-epimerase